jgi:hypothetical protein
MTKYFKYHKEYICILGKTITDKVKFSVFFYEFGYFVFNFIFELAYMSNMRGFHCDNSIHAYSVP